MSLSPDQLLQHSRDESHKIPPSLEDIDTLLNTIQTDDASATALCNFMFRHDIDESRLQSVMDACNTISTKSHPATRCIFLLLAQKQHLQTPSSLYDHLLDILLLRNNRSQNSPQHIEDALKCTYVLSQRNEFLDYRYTELWKRLLDHLTETCSPEPSKVQQQAINNLIFFDKFPIPYEVIQEYLLPWLGSCSTEHVLPYLVTLRHTAVLDELTRDELSKIIMPAKIDRTQPLNAHKSITGRLARLLIASAPGIRDTAGDFLMTLCNDNATELARYFGYGPTAGYLTAKGVMPLLQSQEGIDPITGAIPTKVEEVSWTAEEKEAESQRLADLFDRIERNGILKVGFERPKV